MALSGLLAMIMAETIQVSFSNGGGINLTLKESGNAVISSWEHVLTPRVLLRVAQGWRCEASYPGLSSFKKMR